MNSSLKLPGIRLRLATSQLIRKWAQRQLPNGKILSGQILNPKTVNYQTLKPEKDGLFCERIFGPISDSLCACGRQPQRGQKFCPRCEVEYISSRVRRYRLGYIQLITAAAHIWFFKGSYFSLFLNLPKKKTECLLYCTKNISRTIFPKELENLNFYREQMVLRSFLLKNIPEGDIFSSYWRLKKRPILKLINRPWHDKKNPTTTDGLYRTYFRKKSRWQRGGLRDSALYFGFSLISKMASWRLTTNWFSFVYFLIQPPQKGDLLNKFYSGPPGLVNFWGFKSRLFCLTGVQLMRTWLTQLTQNHCHDGRLLEIQIRLDLRDICDLDNAPKMELFRRLKYIRLLRHIQINPASMILSVLPVLPPDLRPILQLDRHQIAVSDLNKLYQTVLLRNRRLSRLTIDQNFHCLNSEALQYAQRLLQESVDSLIDNGKVNTGLRRPLKSLSDLFKGKKGRFRQNLLGKRVDYSGRSVIVVGPYLKIYECGLPKEMAYELFQPFLLRMLMFQNQAQTILGAKKIFNEKPKHIWSLLKEIVQSHPVLLNRAPTLHRLSIQAFQPRLIEGKAILLHPLVCAAFNADFDGDQMGVHIPLCFESRAEAWKITWSQNNLFSVATGLPVRSPSQDIILGSSFLTTQNTQKFSFLKFQKIFNKKIPNFSMNLLFEKKPIFFNSLHQPLFLMEKSEFTTFPEIKLITFSSSRQSLSGNIPVWYSYNPICNGFETEKKRQKLIEIRLNVRGEFQKFRSQFYQQYHSSDAEILRKIRTTYDRIKFYESLLI